MDAALSPKTRPDPWTASLLLLAVVLTLLGVARHGFVGDDAYITFRYAKNLVDGHGLVYNPGSEPVEGITSLLWAVLVALGMLLGASPEATSQALGVGAGLAVLVLLVRASAEGAGRLGPATALAPLGLALTRAFPAWCTSGLETMAFAAAVTWGLFATGGPGGRVRAREAAIAWTLAVLLRPEGLLVAAIAIAAAGLGATRDRNLLRALAPSALAVVGTTLALTLLRFVLYGDLVPNTARVKVTGLRVDQGLAWLSVADDDLALRLWAPLALVPLLLRRQPRDRVLGAAIVGWLAYVVAIGGDRFEQRFLVPVLPALAWLAVEGARVLVPHRAHPLAALAGALLAGELAARAVAKVPPLRHDVESVRFIGTFAERRLAQGQTLRELVDDGVLPADTRLCVGAAGALPYAAGLWTLDYFGLNDREIALRPPSPGRRIVAHEKRAVAADLVRAGVTMFDATGHMVAHDLGEAREAWKDTATKLRKTAGSAGVLRRVCHRVGTLRLVFATPQPPEVHTRLFGHLPSCEDEVSSP